MSSRRYTAPPRTFCAGSYGSATPSACAVPGMSCIRPAAPVRDVACGSKPDSARTTAVTSAASTPAEAAARRTSACKSSATSAPKRRAGAGTGRVSDAAGTNSERPAFPISAIRRCTASTSSATLTRATERHSRASRGALAFPRAWRARVDAETLAAPAPLRAPPQAWHRALSRVLSCARLSSPPAARARRARLRRLGHGRPTRRPASYGSYFRERRLRDSARNERANSRARYVRRATNAPRPKAVRVRRRRPRGPSRQP